MAYRKLELSRRTRILLGASLAIAVFVVLEVGSRLFLFAFYQIPLWPPGGPAYRFYPGLKHIHQREIRRTDEDFDVLLLGASVLNQVAPILEERIEKRFGGHARLHNACGSGHTSLDSAYKYRHLKDKEFDLVLVYHAINELRTNNASAEDFRDDYSHYSWYETINLFEERRGLGRSGLFLTLRAFWIEAKEKLGLRYYVPRHVPMDGRMHHGNDVKTERTFRRNIEDITRIAHERDESVLLMTFATYVPADYTHEGFLNRQLDYFDYELPIRLWGFEENVVRGIGTHNAVLREIATSRDVALLDQERLMPKDGRLFIDICHLSPAGIDLFVDHILRRLAFAVSTLRH